MKKKELEEHGFRTVLCRGCGKPIVWAVTPKGKPIPLDPRAPVYTVAIVKGEQQCSRATDPELRWALMVSHFATCPNANDFSGRGREATT